MLAVTRRSLFKSAVGAVAAGSLLKSPAVLAQAAPLKLKFGNDLPATHSVNVRLKEAIEAITAETKGQVAISLFPNNQLGSDTDMMTQLRSGALELATMPGTVLSTLIPTASLTGVGFAFTNYDKVWAAMDGEVGKFIRGNIEKVGLVPFEAVWDNGFRQITSSTHPIKTPGRSRELQDPRAGRAAVGFDVLRVRRGAGQHSAQRSLFRAADQDRRRPGKPARADRVREILRSPEVLLADQPCMGWLLAAFERQDLEDHPEGRPGGHAEAFQCGRQQAARRHRPGQRRLPEDPGIEGADLQHHPGGSLPGRACQRRRSTRTPRPSLATRPGRCCRNTPATSVDRHADQWRKPASRSPDDRGGRRLQKDRAASRFDCRGRRGCARGRGNYRVVHAAFPPAICSRSRSSGRTNSPAFSSCGSRCSAPCLRFSAPSTCE